VLGGVFLVALLLDAEVAPLISGGTWDIVQATFGAMRASPPALFAFSAAFLLVLMAGSILTFAVKGGTVATLVRADAIAGAIERPPLTLAALRRAHAVAIEPFLDGCARLWRRYVRLGICLMLVYAGTAGAYLLLLLGGYALAVNPGALLGWTLAAVAGSSAIVVFITLLNVFYLLTQIVIAVDDVGVRTAVSRVGRFVWARLSEILGIFGVVLVVVALATVASILATAGLGLIAFVPLAGFVVFPLTAAGWLLRNVVFEYIALTALSAYLAEYRQYREAPPVLTVAGRRRA
jgi:hypothetical protein